MSTGTTLYYPYIHPRQPNSLKAALLYWDRIRRIVPDSVTHGDRVQGDDVDASLLADNDLLVATPPNDYEDAAARRFFEHLRGHVGRFQIGPDAAREIALRNGGIHIEKLGGRVLAELQDMGLVQQLGDWAYMHREVGAFYMHCLASEMATQMSAPLLADSSDETHIGEAVLFQPDASDKTAESLVAIGINLPKPDELANVPMASIVSFAERHAAERQAFRQAVEDIVEIARTYTDPLALEDHLSSKRRAIQQTVEDLRATLDELKVGTVSGIAKLAVPSGMAAGLAALSLSPATSAILSATGLVVATVSCYAETRGKLRQARTSTPYHYLVSVEKNFPLRRYVTENRLRPA